jgi:hypothetical protein
MRVGLVFRQRVRFFVLFRRGSWSDKLLRPVPRYILEDIMKLEMKSSEPLVRNHIHLEGV